MSKRYDYTKVNKEETVDKTVEEVNEEILEDAAEVEEEYAEEVEETIEAEVHGKVIGCMNLNVRFEADVESKVSRIVSKNDTLIIDGEEGDWYKITTMSGDQGYCMKKYIKKM